MGARLGSIIVPRIFLSLCLALAVSARASAAPAKSINILYIADLDLSSSGVAAVIDGIKEEMEAAGRHAEIYIELLDLFRLSPTADYLDRFQDHLRERYRGLPFDIILAQSSISIGVAARFRDAAFRGVPIYCFDLVEADIVGRYSKVPGIYGRPAADPFTSTFRLARRVFPKAKTAYLLVTVPSPAFIQNFYDIVDAARGETRGLEFKILMNAPFPEVEAALSSAGKDSFALLLPGAWRLPSGEYLTGAPLVDRLSSASSVPLFCSFPSMFGSGLVGGSFYDRLRMGREAGEMILSILYANSKPIPWLYSNSFAPTLDYRALRRFSVPLRLVPADAKLLFAPLPFWVAYEKPIQVFGVVLILAVFALVLFLLYRRKEGLLLKGSNERLEITVSRRTEELQVANEELEATNASLTESLQRIEGMQARLVAETRDAVLGRVALGLAHEINNPLAAIRTSLYSMGEVLGKERDINGLVRSLDAGKRTLLFRLIDHAKDAPAAGDDQGSAARRHALAARIAALSPEGKGGADYGLADLLYDAGLSELEDSDLAAVCLPENRPVLEAAYEARSFANGVAISSQAVERIAQTVEAVRSYARDSDAGKSGTASVEDTIDRALFLFREATRKGLAVVRRVEAGLPAVAAGDSSLVRLWANLFQNAVQAMRGSGQLEVDARRESGLVVVEVLDSGPCVPPAIRDRLFTPLSTMKDIDQGLGLGLSVCKRIVESYGGSISYSEREGRTMFTVKLRIAEGGDA